MPKSGEQEDARHLARRRSRVNRPAKALADEDVDVLAVDGHAADVEQRSSAALIPLVIETDRKTR